MRALAEHYKIDPDSLSRPLDYALLLDKPTRQLVDYSYMALTRRQRGSSPAF